MKAKKYGISVLFAGIMFAADTMIFTLLYKKGLFTSFRLLPLPYASIIGFILITVISVGIVAFASGVVFRIEPKVIHIAAIIYIVEEWLTTAFFAVYPQLQMQESISFSTLALLCIRYAITLLIILVIVKWLCVKGGNIRAKMVQCQRTDKNSKPANR